MVRGEKNPATLPCTAAGTIDFKCFKIACLEIFLSWVTVLEHSIYAGQFHRAHKDMELEKQAMHSSPYVKLESIRDTVVSPP